MLRLSTLAGAATSLLLLWTAAPARAAEPIHPSFSDVEPRDSADATYAANAFAIIHEGMGKAVNDPDSSWMPVRGLVYRVSIERDVFFNTLGRPDLADQFLRRRAYGRTVKWTGYFTAVTGLFFAVVGWGTDYGWLGFVGLGGLVGGAIMREVGVDLMKPVFPEDQAIDMAHRYNEALRARLRLPPGDDPPRKPAPTHGGRLALGAVPLVSTQGAGVALGGCF